MNPMDEDTLVCTFHPIQSNRLLYLWLLERCLQFPSEVHLFDVCLCVCARVHACAYVNVLVNARGYIGYSPVTPYPSPLRQGFSLSLELAWQPASPSNPPVSISHSVRFHMWVVKDSNSNLHTVTESTLSRGAVFPLLSSRSYQLLSHHSAC